MQRTASGLYVPAKGNDPAPQAVPPAKQPPDLNKSRQGARLIVPVAALRDGLEDEAYMAKLGRAVVREIHNRGIEAGLLQVVVSDYQLLDLPESMARLFKTPYAKIGDKPQPSVQRQSRTPHRPRKKKRS